MNIVLKTKLQLLIPVLWLLGIVSAFSQDIHFSQFYNAPLMLSPALTGISKGDIRINALYRSQWNAANSPFKTYDVSAEKKFYNINHDRWWFSAGVNLFHDEAGDGNLARNSFLVTGSFTKMLQRRTFLSAGAMVGLGQRNFDLGNFTWDEMWNGDFFDPNGPNGEDFNKTNLIYGTIGGGANMRHQFFNSRSKIDFGIGFYHINLPNQAFYDNDKSRMPMRASFHVIPVWQIKNDGEIVGAGTIQSQGEYFEALVNAGYRHYLSTQRAKEVAVQFTMGYRFHQRGDAIMPAAEFHYHDFMVGLSWDMNISKFRTATNRNGGPELSFRYIIHKVYPLRAFKACPLI